MSRNDKAASETISRLATSGSAASALRGSKASILPLMMALYRSVKPLCDKILATVPRWLRDQVTIYVWQLSW